MYACSKVLNFTHFSSFPSKEGNDLLLELLKKAGRYTCGSAPVIYIDMCELSVDRYASYMLCYVIICGLYDNNYGTMCSRICLR